MIPKVSPIVLADKVKELSSHTVEDALSEIHFHGLLAVVSLGLKHLFLVEVEEKLQVVFLFVTLTGGSFIIRRVYPRFVKRRQAKSGKVVIQLDAHAPSLVISADRSHVESPDDYDLRRERIL